MKILVYLRQKRRFRWCQETQRDNSLMMLDADCQFGMRLEISRAWYMEEKKEMK